MAARLKILSVLSLVLLAATIKAQQANERLDSIINSLELKEVVVTAKKIKQSGDTISYSAATYRGKNDKTLEDLLRKMPGIEVKADGQISFNGQWINEFYIEGLDMLGGNYGVATRNIDARDIGTVQVLQNHQDVKMLQGVKSGNAPAMNIKLKQNALGIWTSTLQAAIGSQPDFSWDASASLMNFRRKAQNISVYKANNIGKDLRTDIGASPTFSPAYGTGILFPNPPGLDDRYAYRNDSHSLSVNQLFKLAPDRTMAFNATYLYDKERRDAAEQTVYLADSLSRYVVDESNRAGMRQHSAGVRAVFKDNGKKSYLKNTFAANITFPRGNGTINDLIHQKFTGRSINIDDLLKINYRTAKGGIGDATLHVNYGEKQGELSLPEKGIRQNVRQRKFSADGSTSIIAVAIPHFMFNLNGGFNARWQQAKTLLDERQDSDSGNQRIWQIGVHVNPKLLLHNGQRFQWLIYAPVGIEYYSSADGTWKYDKAFLSIKPYMNVTYKPTERWSVMLTSTCEESMPTPLSLMAERRYVDYRTTVSNANRLESRINRTVKTSLNAGYTSVLDMVFGGLTLTHAYIRNSLSNGYDIADDVVGYVLLPHATKGNILQADQSFSKGFFRWNSKISESFSMGTSKSEYYVDDRLRRGRSNYLRASVSYNASFTGWLTFDTSNEFSLSKTYTDGISNVEAKHTFASISSLTVWPFRRLSVRPSVMYYYNDYTSSGRSNTFLNCNIEYTLGETILSIDCSNLLDSRYFRRYNDNGIIRHTSEYRLRGRTIMFGVRFRIT